MEIFQTLAEVSIGILGFTAIVIMFKSQNSKWNHDMFSGMIAHGIQAFIYSVLPFILIEYHCTLSTTWTVCSAVLGTFTFFQGISVAVLDRSSKLNTRLIMVITSTTVSVLQYLNIFGIWTQQEKGPYIVGIVWHVLQALIIFSMIVTKKTEEDKSPKG